MVRKIVGEAMSEIDLITQMEPDSFLAESYRKVSVNLCNLLSSTEGGGRVIAFSSVLPGDGTTTTTANLAVTMAKNGRRTVLVDCNFRNPAQNLIFSRLLKHRIMLGLGDYLSGKIMRENLIQETGVDGLCFVANGMILQNPAQFFATERMRLLLNALRKEYEFIFLDLPAVLPVADTLAVTDAADGVVLTVSAGRVSPKAAKVAVERLQKSGGQILGVILNRIVQSYESGYKDYEHYRKL